MKKAIIFSAILSMLFLTNSITQAQPMPQRPQMGPSYHNQIKMAPPSPQPVYHRPMPKNYRHHHSTFGSFFRGLNISLNF